MSCGASEMRGCIQTSSVGTPVSTLPTILFGGSTVATNPIVSAVGLFGNLSAVAVVEVSLRLGGVSGAEVVHLQIGPLETRAWLCQGFDTIVATATANMMLTYTIQLQTRE